MHVLLGQHSPINRSSETSLDDFLECSWDIDRLVTYGFHVGKLVRYDGGVMESALSMCRLIQVVFSTEIRSIRWLGLDISEEMIIR